jgi:peptidoglycan/LPS O-acetylase OafA/YrhL
MDALRGMAAVGIVMGHSYGPLSGVTLLDNAAGMSGVAVQVFFALSGFLLFRPYVSAFARGEKGPSVRRFLRRRALRILPAYWVALTLAALLFGSVIVPGVFSDRWWVFYGFVQVYSFSDNFRGLGVAWTLCVEVSFYLALPLLAALVRRIGPWPVIVPMLVLGPVVHLLNTISFSDPDVIIFIHRIVYALPGECSFFAVGMALAVFSVRETPSPVRWLSERPTVCWGLAAAVYLLACNFLSFTVPVGGLDFRTRFVGVHLAILVIVFLALVPAAFDRRPGVPRTVLEWRPLVFAGAVSYGLYLWHAPVGVWSAGHIIQTPILEWDFAARFPLTFVVTLGGGLLFATISYYVVELPFLRLKDRGRSKARKVPVA